MEAKLTMFSISELKYDRLRVSSSEVELDITEKANATIKLTNSKKCQARINVEVNIKPVLKTDDSKSMIVLSTNSYFEFPEEPQREDIAPYVVMAVNNTRKALNDITIAIKIRPIEMDEFSIEDLDQT